MTRYYNTNISAYTLVNVYACYNYLVIKNKKTQVLTGGNTFFYLQVMNENEEKECYNLKLLK